MSIYRIIIWATAVFGIFAFAMAMTARAESVTDDASIPVVQTVGYQPGQAPALSPRGSCMKYDRLIQRESAKYRNSDRLYKLAHVVMYIESRCNPRARSRVGARGLMQVMPSTARSRVLGYRGSTNGMYDPATNIRLGVKYLDYCLTLAHGDTREAGICYNGGPRRMNLSNARLPKETQGYIVLIARYSNQHRRARARNI